MALKNRIFTFLFIFIIGVFSSISYFTSFMDVPYLYGIVYIPILNITIFTLILIALSNINFKLLRLSSIILFSLLLSLDLGCLIIYKSPLEYGIIASMYETDKSEMFSMSKSLILPSILTMSCVLIITLKSSYEIRRIKIGFIKPFLLVTIITSGLYFVKSEFLKITSLDALSTITSHHIQFIFKNFISTKYYLQEQDIIKSYSLKHRDIPKGITYNKKSDSIPNKIIFVFGESSTKTHYSLYGYNTPTTPALDNFYKHNDIQFSNKAISCAPCTLLVTKMIFSYCSTKNIDDFDKEKNLVEMAKNAGYTTYWFSNNGAIGKNLNTTISMFAKSSDKTYFPTTNLKDDIFLSEKLNQYLKNDSSKQFFVIHLQGSHASYTDKFNDIDVNALSKYNDSKYIDYDRSIHHTDRLLEQIVNQVKKQKEKSILFYLSDHGEIVNLGHCLTRYDKSQYEIPLIYMSNNYDVKNIENLINKYTSPNGFYNSSNTTLVLSELMGYKISQEIVNKDINDGNYIITGDKKTLPYTYIEKLPSNRPNS